VNGSTSRLNRHGRPPRSFNIVSGEDGCNTRQAAGVRGVDREFRMRMGRAQHQRVHHRGRRVVVGVGGPCRESARRLPCAARFDRRRI